MSQISSRLNTISAQIDKEFGIVKGKTQQANGVWQGEAQKSFYGAYQDLAGEVREAKGKIHSIQRTVQSLEASIREADRDIAAKKAAKNK